jgi:tyrosyl-tRNA synthetase
MTIAEQVALLSEGTISVLPREELIKKIERKGKLTIKLGVDPTAPDLHLGHAVVLSKLRQFQDFGHHIIFLLGTFTTRIGDPTGKSKTRPTLSDEQIENNAKTYFEQVQKILDPQKLTIRYNSEWMDILSSKDFVTLCSKVTLAQMITREDFAKRLKENQPIALHEILYPLIQGYDSVELKADVEIGGTDQTFNLLMGRYLQEQYNQEPQVVITLPLLEGLDGVQKMSKSLNNYIGLSERAENAYGKILSISDELMWRYYNVLLYMSENEIVIHKEAIEHGNEHPLVLKKQLAYKIVERFWSQQEATDAQIQFETLFQKRDFSQAQEIVLPLKDYTIVALIKNIEEALSLSQIRRLISEGAVSVNEKKKNDPFEIISLSDNSLDTILRIGKHRIFRIKR